MSKIMISLRMIRDRDPCIAGWANVCFGRGVIDKGTRDRWIYEGESEHVELPKDMFPLSDCFESNGIEDVLWSLQCLPEHGNLWRKYAVWCAKQVEHLMTDDRSKNALDVAWRHSECLATNEELSAARAAAMDAAWAAARDAAIDAAGAAAGAAAIDAARAAAIDAQKQKLIEVLNTGVCSLEN